MSPSRVTTQSVRSSRQPIDIVIVDTSNGKVVEQVRLVRYAGHFRSDDVEAFVVRDDKGKVRVRSERDLGLVEGAVKAAYDAETYIDLRSA